MLKLIRASLVSQCYYLFKSVPESLYNCVYLQVRVAGLVTTLVNVTGGHQGATNALATEDGTMDTRNGTTPKVKIIMLIIFNSRE